jgi:hypothetical protein
MRSAILAFTLNVALALSIASAAGQAPPPAVQPAAGGGRKLALLVGVSKYDHLAEAYQLVGPANDVESIGHVLRDRGFDPADVVTLREGPGPSAGRPTRDNILRALDQLAERARPGDWVVVFIAGHGSKEPKPANEAADDDANPEATTGLFLPCDVVPASAGGGFGQIRNAIEDHEFSDRIKPILDKGAWVWLIDDSCHSGGLVRGADDVYREVPPSVLGVSDEAMRRAEQLDEQRAAAHAAAAAAASSSPTTRPSLAHVIDSPRFAATYACRRSEPTLEMPLPADATGPTPAARHGLFTYCLCRAIESAQSPVTFAELINRVHLAYDAQGRSGTPYPVVEGRARDNLMFSGDTRRAGVRLAKADDGWTVNAGLLGSLNQGSILAVFPPDAPDTTGKPVGYVRVDNADPFTAKVSPVAYGDQPAPAADQLAAGALCKTVFYDFGPDPLRVSVEPVAADPADDGSTAAVAAASAPPSADPAVVAAADAERADLQTFTKDCHLAVVVEPHANPRPQWRVATYQRNGVVRTTLVCVATGVTFRAPANADTAKWVRDALSKISRGENLLKIAGAATTVSDDSDGLKVTLELTVTPRGSTVPRTFNPAAGGLALHDGDHVRFRIRNGSDPNGGRQADVTLLFLDADYAVAPLYPRGATVGENRIGPGQYRDYSDTVRANTTGTERVLLIAQDGAASPVPTDFSWLEETGIARGAARGVGADTELAQLLIRSHFQQGGPASRGLGGGDAARTFMQVITWDTQK